MAEHNLRQRPLSESHKMQALGQMTDETAHDFNVLLIFDAENARRPAKAHDPTTDVRMGQLRKKLSINTPGKAIFTTIHDSGYMLNGEVNTLQPE